MTHTIQDVQDELTSDDRFEVELTDENILRIKSDDFVELPFGVPHEVQVYETDERQFDARPVGGGGERFEMTFKNTIHYITESLTQTNN